MACALCSVLPLSLLFIFIFGSVACVVGKDIERERLRERVKRDDGLGIERERVERETRVRESEMRSKKKISIR